MTDEELSVSDATLIARWDDYVESMGSVMGEVEHMAQQMRDRIEALVKEAKEMGEGMVTLSHELDTQRARAERLEAERDALISVLADCPIPQVAEEARAAIARLKGADHE